MGTPALGYMQIQVICKCYTVLYKGLEHLWLWYPWGVLELIPRDPGTTVLFSCGCLGCVEQVLAWVGLRSKACISMQVHGAVRAWELARAPQAGVGGCRTLLWCFCILGHTPCCSLSFHVSYHCGVSSPS